MEVMKRTHVTLPAQPSTVWTVETYRSFHIAYIQAKHLSQEDFTFNGGVYLTSYAGYLIQYLQSQLGITPKH